MASVLAGIERNIRPRITTIQAARSISTWRNSIEALSWVSNRAIGTPSLTVKAIVMDVRVQNFRCFQPDGSGSSGKLRPKSITVTAGPPSGFARRLALPKNASRLGRQRRPAQPQAGGSGSAKLLYSGLPYQDLGWVTPSTSPMMASLGRSNVVLPIGRPPPVIVSVSPSEESSTRDVPRDTISAELKDEAQHPSVYAVEGRS